MSLKVSRCLSSAVLLLVFFAAQLPIKAQSVPCAAITRNPLVLEALLDSHSKDGDSDLQDDTINAAQMERLQFSPIVIQPGDALYMEYRGKDFTVNADFTSGERTEFDSSPKGSYEQWRKGVLPLDMFRGALNQRVVRLRAVAKNPNQVLFRNIKIIRAGRPVFEFAKLSSYGKPQVRTAVERQLPCVGFDDVPVNGTSTAVSYSPLNPGPTRNFSGGLAQPILPPFPMMMQSATTGTDPNHYKFNGKELDAESGLYNYGARYYSPALGRYMTPDWSRVPTPVPYANLNNPQSLNLYTYGKNNPTTFADVDGHCPSDDCKKVQVTVTAPAVDVVQNAGPINGRYKSGVGTVATVTLTDKKGHPMAGVQVKENPVTKDNLTGNTTSGGNPSTVSTSGKGTIQDVIVAPLRNDAQPHTFTPEDSAAMKDGATSLPYNRTTDQTLTFSVGKQDCQCTYSETLSNSDSQGNLNTQNNSNGLNFTFTATTPVVQRVEPAKKDKEPN